jgi:hypothetical protein
MGHPVTSNPASFLPDETRKSKKAWYHYDVLSLKYKRKLL